MKKLLIVVSILFFIKNNTAQGPSYNEEFRVNNSIDGIQSHESISALSNGGFVISWSNYPFGSDWDVFAQIFDENADKIGEQFQVNTFSEGSQQNGEICSLPNGGFLICWHDEIQDSSDYGIFAQIFDSQGSKIGEEFQVNTFSDGRQFIPSVDVFNENKIVISWQSKYQDGSGFGIFSQIFDSNGLKLGEEFQVNTFTNDDQTGPSVAGLKNGGFVISWTSRGQDGSRSGIYAQMYDSSGFKIGEEFQVNSHTYDDQMGAFVCSLKQGGFVICWSSFEQDGSDKGVYAQIYNEVGAKVGEEFRVNNYTHNLQTAAGISSLNNGGFIITWESRGQDGYVSSGFAQIFDSEGIRMGNEFRLSGTVSNFQSPGTIAEIIDGKLVVTWDRIVNENLKAVFGKYFLAAPIDHNLIPYELLQPESSSNVDHANPKFSWNHASNVHINFPWELTYDLYIDTDIGFSNPIIQSGIQDSTFQIDSLANGQTYYWKVLAKNYYGDSLWSSTVNDFTIDTAAVVGVNIIDPEIPEKFNLFQNYPNPFNPTTKINFQLPNAGVVNIVVYDILGRKVQTLMNEYRSEGKYTLEFDASKLASGMYIYSLQVNGFVMNRKMMLLK